MLLEDIELEQVRTLDLVLFDPVLEERAWIGEDGGRFIALQGEMHPFREMLEGEDVLDEVVAIDGTNEDALGREEVAEGGGKVRVGGDAVDPGGEVGRGGGGGERGGVVVAKDAAEEGGEGDGRRRGTGRMRGGGGRRRQRSRRQRSVKGKRRCGWSRRGPGRGALGVYWEGGE